MITSVTVDDIKDGNRIIFRFDKNRYLFVDAGGVDQLKDFKEEIKGTHPHITLVITHDHSDHTNQVKTLLEMHKERNLTIGTVYMNLSFLRSDLKKEILETDENIEIKDLEGNKEEVLERLAYKVLIKGKLSEEDKELIKNYNKNLKQEDRRCITDIENKVKKYKKEIKESLKEDIIRNRYNNQEEFDIDVLEKEVSKDLNSLLGILSKCKNNNIKLCEAEEQEYKIYDAKVNFWFLNKIKMKNFISDNCSRGELFKSLGLTDLSDEEFIAKGYKNDNAKTPEEEFYSKVQNETTENLFMYLKKEFSRAKSERIKEAVNNMRENPKELAYLLNIRIMSNEENMNSLACLVRDDNFSCYCGGDTELPFELQKIIEGIEIAVDLFVKAHHDKFTSNCCLYILNTLVNSLDERKNTVFASSLSGDTKKINNENNFNKENLLPLISFYTSDSGNIVINISDGKKYVKTKETDKIFDKKIKMWDDLLNEAINNEKIEDIKKFNNNKQKAEKQQELGLSYDYLSDYFETKIYVTLERSLRFFINNDRDNELDR